MQSGLSHVMLKKERPLHFPVHFFHSLFSIDFYPVPLDALFA